jgi:hypothetical protein
MEFSRRLACKTGSDRKPVRAQIFSDSPSPLTIILND